MIVVPIDRFAETPFGTFGRTRLKDGMELYTLEPVWNHNAKGKSCIPPGMYLTEPSYYHKGGYAAPELQGVYDRTEILFHVGNTLVDTSGCILLGSDLGFVSGLWAITGSTVAFSRFMAEYGDERFYTDVRYVRH